jgi:hypothetical protein
VSSLLRPVGHLPARVYWVRRLLVAVVVFALLAAVWAWWSGRSSGDDVVAEPKPSDSAAPTASGEGSPSASADPSSAPSDSGSPSAPVSKECADSEIAVTVRTDRPTYTPEQNPNFAIIVTNTGTRSCERNLGQDALELKVRTAKGDAVWSSDDCSPGGDPEVKTLAPGEAVDEVVNWPRRTSEPDCPSPAGTAPPGQYQLSGRAGTASSAPVDFTLQ